jgi:cobalt transporter subunit CbtA
VLASLVFRSVLAGLIVGVIVTLAHQFWTVPLILRGETYEQSADKAAVPHDHATAPVHGAADGGHSHDHDDNGWKPADGIERMAFTAGADILTAIGFAMLLSGAYVLSRRQVAWREGVFWGLAGFAVFTIAPSLGLPPELPGMPATALGPRQEWWLATAALTAAGLGLLVLRQQAWSAALGILLIVAPHLWGAPPPASEATAVPEALWRDFVVAVTVTNFVSWVLLGSMTGFLHARSAHRAN